MITGGAASSSCVRLTRAVASARTVTADAINIVRVHAKRYTCSQSLTHLVLHPLRHNLQTTWSHPEFVSWIMAELRQLVGIKA